MSKYINPYTDFGFKRMFGTEGNKEMPYFTKKENELLTHYDKLKHLENFDNIPQILNEKVFNKAFHTAEIAAMNKKEREEYEQSKLVYAELKSAIDTSKEEGFQEGELSKALQIAKGLKDDGIPLNIISKNTGLSFDEIEKL